MQIYTYMDTHTYTDPYRHTPPHTHTHTHTYIYMCVCVCVCVCIYINIYKYILTVIYLGFIYRLIRRNLIQKYFDDPVGETLVDYFWLCRYFNFALFTRLSTFTYWALLRFEHFYIALLVFCSFGFTFDYFQTIRMILVYLFPWVFS